MAVTWRIAVGKLEARGTEIVVPAKVIAEDDGDKILSYDISESIQAGIQGTPNDVKAEVAARLKAKADAIKDQYELWDAIKDVGEINLPGWP